MLMLNVLLNSSGLRRPARKEFTKLDISFFNDLQDPHDRSTEKKRGQLW